MSECLFQSEGRVVRCFIFIDGTADFLNKPGLFSEIIQPVLSGMYWP